MHLVTWVGSMLGPFAAAIGAWIMLAPDDGMITINSTTWAAADLTETRGTMAPHCWRIRRNDRDDDRSRARPDVDVDVNGSLAMLTAKGPTAT